MLIHKHCYVPKFENDPRQDLSLSYLRCPTSQYLDPNMLLLRLVGDEEFSACKLAAE